jgi:hypothetical protein
MPWSKLKFMKKTIWLPLIAIIFCLSIVISFPAQAADLSNAFDTNTISAASGNTNNSGSDIFAIGGMIIQVLLSLLGVVFMVLIVYSGVIWTTAEGDEAKIEKAQRILRSAIIGLIVVLAAYAISYFAVSIMAKAALGKK